MKLSSFELLKTAGFKSQYAPNDNQLNVIVGVATSDAGIVVVEGVPGSGKTSGVLKWLVGFVRGANPATKVYVSAPNAGGMIAVNGDFKDESGPGQIKILDFNALTTDITLDDNAYVIVDECYMMSKEQLQALLKIAVQKNWRLLFSGDSLQNLPQDSIYGFLDAFPTFSLDRSFRARRCKEQNFANVYLRAYNQHDPSPISKGLEYLSQVRPDQLEKLGPIRWYVAEHRNIFVSIDQDESMQENESGGIAVDPEPGSIVSSKNLPSVINQRENSHLWAAAYWAEANLKDPTIGIKNTMIIAHRDDLPMISNFLQSRGISEDDVKKILKTSAESQGAGAAQVAVVLNKMMTQSEIYVALTRHKSDIMLMVPISQTNSTFFKSIDDAIRYPYHSTQRGIKNLQGAAKKVKTKIALSKLTGGFDKHEEEPGALPVEIEGK